jgi:Fic family protein
LHSFAETAVADAEASGADPNEGSERTLEELRTEAHHGRRESRHDEVEETSELAASSRTPNGGSEDATPKTLELVVLLLRGQRGGLRPEQLRQKLGVPKPVMTRVLKQGLAAQRIFRRGERRATTYFAATK